MDRVIQDVRYGLRRLAGSPLFTVMAVLIIALGIAAKALGGVEAVANFRERAAGDLQELQFLAGCVPSVSFCNIRGN
jgi:hypothetical protein